MKCTSQRKAMSARKNFDFLIQNFKCTSKSISKSADGVLEQQAITIKPLRPMWHQRNCLLSSCAINWKNEHNEAMSDLLIAQRSKVHDLQFCHETNLSKEKKKLCMKSSIPEQLRQNSLYNEFLDCCQYDRGVAKLGSV